MLKVFSLVFKHNLEVFKNQTAVWLHPILFLFIIVSLFGMGSFEAQTLQSIAAQVIWIGFLLITLLNIEGFLKKDIEEGSFEPFFLSAHPLWWLILAKSSAIWFIMLPAICLIPFFGALLQLSFSDSMLLMYSVFLGSPALVLISVLGTSMISTLPRSSVLLSIILLPLYVPLLLLGTSVLHLDSQQCQVDFILLAALSVLTITLLPHAIAIAITSSLDG